jgi:hypothetical protein
MGQTKQQAASANMKNLGFSLLSHSMSMSMRKLH